MGRRTPVEFGQRELDILHAIVADPASTLQALQQAVAVLECGLPGAAHSQTRVAMKFGVSKHRVSYSIRQLFQDGRLPNARWGNRRQWLDGDPRNRAAALLRNATAALAEHQQLLAATAAGGVRTAEEAMRGAAAATRSEPLRRKFTEFYKRGVMDAYDNMPRGPQRAAFLRSEGIDYAHLLYWRKQLEKGTLAVTTGMGKPVRRRRPPT